MSGSPGRRAAPRAIVFCAGEGTRLRPLTADRPKPMLPIAGRPILDYLLAWLREQGIGEVAINLHYRPDAIRQHVGDGSALGLRVTYSEEPRLLGSAGALRPLRAFLADGGAPFVAVYGDTLTTMPLAPLFELHRDVGADLTMALIDHPNPSEAGIVDLVERRPWRGGERGRVARLVEKPRPEEVFSRIASAGVCVVEPGAIDLVPTEGAFDLSPGLISALLATGRTVAGWRVPPSTHSIDVGSWANYTRMQAEWPAIWSGRGAGERRAAPAPARGD